MKAAGGLVMKLCKNYCDVGSNGIKTIIWASYIGLCASWAGSCCAFLKTNRKKWQQWQRNFVISIRWKFEKILFTDNSRDTCAETNISESKWTPLFLLQKPNNSSHRHHGYSWFSKLQKRLKQNNRAFIAGKQRSTLVDVLLFSSVTHTFWRITIAIFKK